MRSSVSCILILLTIGVVNGQNLIERTMLGLSCQSTDQPNKIAENITQLKSGRTLPLFKFDEKNQNKSKGEVPLSISSENLNLITKERPSFFSVPIPITSDKEFILDLYKVELYADDSRIITHSDTLAVSSKNLFYRGIIADDFGSIVTLSIIDNKTYISVNDMHGTYRVNPNENKSKSYKLSIDLSREDGEYSCGTGSEHHLGSTQLHSVGDGAKGSSTEKALTDEVKIYVVCDYQLYSDVGSTTSATAAYVNLLFTEVIALYANEQINMVVSDIFIYTSASSDPYAANGSNTIQTLYDFGDNTPHTFNGDVASLLQGGGYSGGCSLSGIAWVDVLCNRPPNSNYGPYNINWGLGDCSINPNGTTYNSALDVSIVAHEIGHNLGSPHTHSCCWGTSQNQAIDNCVSTTNCSNGRSQSCGLVPNLPASDRKTIMSYCGNSTPFSNGFGSLPGNLIRNRVATANCLTGGGIPNCTNNNITYSQQSIPNGTEVYANNQINILNNVSIGSNANVMMSAENSLDVTGTFTVNAGAEMEVIAADCN